MLRKQIYTTLQISYEISNGNFSLDILGDAALLSADEVHPNIYGVQQIAERMTDLLKDI